MLSAIFAEENCFIDFLFAFLEKDVLPKEVHSYTVESIRKIYSRIAGNQLPGHVPLFLTGTNKNYLT